MKKIRFNFKIATKPRLLAPNVKRNERIKKNWKERKRLECERGLRDVQ